MGHGSVLAGRYRLEERVRTGPDGSQWRAVDETLDRQVAVQVLRAGHPYAEEVVDAARRAALVEDPRLLRVLDVGQEAGIPYIVAERVQARPLSELLAAGPVPAETARRLVGEAAQALDRAGRRGLHHLRLSPRNLLVSPDGSVKVTGTAIDAAADGEEVEAAGAASRIDAVGLVSVLYAALTSRWPGPHTTDLPRAPRVAGRAVPPGDLVAGVPNDLDTLCAVTLGPHDDGPNTPADLARQLAPWARVEPLTDPRGLTLAGPVRPATTGAGGGGGLPTLLPQEADDAGLDVPVRAPDRTPARGAVRAGRAAASAAHPRGRAGSPGTGPSVPVVGAGPTPTPPAGPLAVPLAGPDPDLPAPGGPAEVHEPAEPRAVGPGPGERLATASEDDLTPAGIPLAAGPQAGRGPHAAAALPSSDAPATGPDLPPRLIDATVLWEGPPVPVDARERSGALNGTGPDELRAGRRPEPELYPVERGALAGPSEVLPEYPSHPPEYAPEYRSAQRLPGPAGYQAAHPSEPAGSGLGGSLLTGREVQDPGSARGSGWPADPGDDLWSDWETLGRPVPAEEQLAPFGPAVPVGRPPHDQTRLVLLVLGGLVLLGLLWAGWSLSNFRGSSLIGPAVAVSPQAGRTPSAAVAGPSAAPAPGRPTRPPAPPPEISGVVAIDPEGDGDENGSSAPRAIDGDPATAWRSERYGSPEFGGIKDGVGLVLDLGDPSRVSRVTLDAPGEGGTVELRTAPGPGFDGSTPVAEAAIEGGRVVLAPRRAISTQYVLVWFTKVPRSDDGDNRIYVTEIDVR